MHCKLSMHRTPRQGQSVFHCDALIILIFMENTAERVSLDQVLRVAELAQLELTAEEQTDMLRDLNSILGHVAQLNELDTADIPAMAQVSQMMREGSQDAGDGDGLREDTRRPSLGREVVMAEAPETDGTYFKVPKVIER